MIGNCPVSGRKNRPEKNIWEEDGRKEEEGDKAKGGKNITKKICYTFKPPV
jgi:hypothetical protein